MKLNNLFYSLVFISCALFAQEDKSETISLQTLEKNELKLNMFELLVMPAIGITYERYINPTSSFGAYGFVNFGIDEDIAMRNLNSLRSIGSIFNVEIN